MQGFWLVEASYNFPVSETFIFGFFGILPLGALIVLVLFRKKLTTLNLGDKIILYAWLILFAWGFGGVALAMLLHKTFFLLRGGFAVLGTILLVIATVFWLAYRLFRTSLDEMNKRRQ
jgi:hypothetical protein